MADKRRAGIGRRRYLRSLGATSALAAVGLAGCSRGDGGGDGNGGDGSGDGTGGGGDGGGSTGGASGTTMMLQLNTPAFEGSVHGDVGVWLNEIVSAETDGAIEIETFRNSELGGTVQSVQDVSSGSLDMYILPYSGGAIVGVNQAVVFDAPYLYDPDNPYEEIYEKTDPQDSEQAQGIVDALAEAGIRSLGAVVQGTRRVSLSVADDSEPPRNPEMMSNYKLRAAPNKMFAETVKGLGAQTTNIEPSELNQALATGSVDGQENPYNIIRASQVYEEQTHVIETNHMHTPLNIMMSEQVFQELTDSQQQIFYDAVREVQPRASETLSSTLEEVKSFLRDEGLTLVPPEDIEYDSYRSATRARIREAFSPLVELFSALAHDGYGA
jgi:TRAP-type C4-dicarboxylate transport system substrate-binding protein